MILEVMLQRLYQSLLKGPGLNARPNNSRQRVDVTSLATLSESKSPNPIKELLESGKFEIPASAPRFKRPDYPEAEWSDEQKAQRNAWEKQVKLLRKLSGIATDAKEYFNDHGEDALFVGFPLVSLPPNDDRQGLGSSRVIAPLGMIPVNIAVRTNARAGVTVTTTAEGADRLIPNPALLAWIERMTGERADSLYDDEGGDNPWKELQSILEFVAKGVGLETLSLDSDAALKLVPKSDGLPDKPALLNSAVMGLFPMKNPGMIRDTQWMIDNEENLEGPVRSFLKREAIYGDGPADLPAAEEVSVEEQANFQRNFAGEFMITRADPCQAAAVEEAATARALVIHGPPGTGKSQTIANIIGDHLARGERVLFVCDKRTALDVVKYRLDALGVGHLCGVIHDPQRDRKEFYMGLRSRLEELVEMDLPFDEAPKLAQVNDRLTALHQELRDAYRSLHGEEEAESFHFLVGRWMELSDCPELIEGAQLLTPSLAEESQTIIAELCGRAKAARLSVNPLLGALTFKLQDYFSATAGNYEQKLKPLASGFVLAGDGQELPALSPALSLQNLETGRRGLSEKISRYASSGFPEFTKIVLKEKELNTLGSAWEDLRGFVETVSSDLDRELAMQTKGENWTVAQLNQSLVALRDYAGAMTKWTKVFAFGKKKAAAAELSKFGQQLEPAQALRTSQFLEGVKARLMLNDFLSSLKGEANPVFPPSDEVLRGNLDAVQLGIDIGEAISQDEVLKETRLEENLIEEEVGNWSETLELSAQRASSVLAQISKLDESGLFEKGTVNEWEQSFREGSSGTEFSERYAESCDCLEETLRVADCLSRLPSELSEVGRALALAETEEELANASIGKAAIANAIRSRLEASPKLARIDTVRIEAAFSELGERIEEKQELVKRVVIRYWQDRQSRRVLANTGSRLNSTGSSLRGRLYVRGKKALRLRQMISTGSDVAGGDPLFDLCPVWMASPDTVAQIFSREAEFDVAIFDEASQCRLEEALPVLLRAKRLVVAGDPKQLPPTRFFEGAVIESDEGEIETEEELHSHQMSEMEDLLSAALNLDVSEAFLDVHYRSRNESLIGFSNESFYGERLQPIPGHPKNKALSAPIRLTNVDGVYKEQSNPAEGLAVVEKVVELLSEELPPSIGIATFNIKQRNLIIEMLDERAASDSEFSLKLSQARSRRGDDSFEGLFVKNLENVQGDERDVMIISTTFGRDEEGKFRRNFGALSRVGGERRLNVLVTRARSEILIMTSIPREEYQSGLGSAKDSKPNGRHFLYSYLCYAERLKFLYDRYHDELEAMKVSEIAECEVHDAKVPSKVAEAFGQSLKAGEKIGSTVHWGNDGFMVDVALTHPTMPEDVTLGVLTDFNRYRNTPDPIDWELFRSSILRNQGWLLERIWSPRLFRDSKSENATITKKHLELLESEAVSEIGNESEVR